MLRALVNPIALEQIILTSRKTHHWDADGIEIELLKTEAERDAVDSALKHVIPPRGTKLKRVGKNTVMIVINLADLDSSA